MGRTDIRVTLPAAARIEGTVIDEDTGKPVSIVRVLARPHRRAGARYGLRPERSCPGGVSHCALAILAHAARAAPAAKQEGITYTSAGEENVKIILGQTLSFARSLPWLVLADRNRIIRAEGFPPAALPQKVDELARN